jgi:type I restriction-modification system DNA methylase subunit
MENFKTDFTFTSFIDSFTGPEILSFTDSVLYIFNILKLENITGLNAIRHCKILLGLQSGTKELFQKLDIPLEYTFDNFLKDKKGNDINDHTFLLKKFYNPDLSKPCYFKYIKEKGKFLHFDFQIQSGTNFVNIYKKLQQLDISALKSINDRCDLYGIIYQLYLDTCNSITKKELCVYHTHRNLTKFIINLCDPKVINNKIETILDPSCGTGGFLSMSTIYLNNKYPDIDWSVNKNNIYGFDNNPICKNMTMISLLTETNQLFDSTISCRDTLCEDYNINNTLIDKVDIIMCHIPFGIRNFKFANACPRIKKLKFDGTKAEPLFLQLILQSLSKNGRAAIIIPDNLLENSAKLHTQTRQYLVETLNLKKVINIDDNALNLGIKQSIIYFENNGKTENVEFSKIIFKNNECIEESIITVKYDDITKKNYYLNSVKYIYEDKPILQDIESYKLGDICSSKYVELLENSTIDKDSIIISGNDIHFFDEITKNYKFTNKKCILIKTSSSLIKIKFIYYYLLFIKSKINTNKFNIEYINDIQFPKLSNDIILKLITNLDLIHQQIKLNDQIITNYTLLKNQIFWTHCYNKPIIKLSELVQVNIVKSNELSMNNNTNIYISKNGKIIFHPSKKSDFIPYLSLRVTNDLIILKYVYYYLMYNENVRNILESTTISKTTIENLNISMLSKCDQIELISDYDENNNKIKNLNYANNKLLSNNVIFRILNLDDKEKYNEDDNDDNRSVRSSSSSTSSKNINIM